jgi:hypothetical protein
VSLTTSTLDTCRARAEHPTEAATDECLAPFAVPFAISLGPNWVLRGETADFVVFEHRGDPYGYIEAILVAATLDPPCQATTPQFTGERDVIAWLSSRRWLNSTDPRPYNIGTYLGRSVDIEVPSADRWTCAGEPETGRANMFRLGGASDSEGPFGSWWWGDSGERYRMIAIEVQGRTVIFAVGREADGEEFWQLSDPLLQTIDFEESAS